MGTNGDPLGVNIEIERLRAQVTEAEIAVVPRVPCEPNSPVAGEASHRIKRLCAVRQLVQDECRALVVQGAEIDLLQRQAFLAIIEGHLELEIWRHFPELIGKTYVIYDNWRVGPEGPATRDLFDPSTASQPETRARNVVSTRSDDIRPNQVFDFRFPVIDPGR